MSRRGVFLGLGLTSLVIAGAACSSDGGTGVTAPSPAPSGVVLGTLGNISCTAPDNPVPGTYTTIETNGTVANNTYTGNQGYNSYATNAYTAPNGGSPAPTPTPIVIPSVPPTTPGAVLWIVYYGEYTIPATAGFSTAPTNGCFTLYTANIDQSVESGSRGVLTGTPAPSPSPFIAQGFSAPMFAPPYPVKSADILDGDITTFTINNLTRTSGTGAFTLNTNQVGDVTTVSGTATITGSVAFYVNENGDNSYSFKRRVQSMQGGFR